MANKRIHHVITQTGFEIDVDIELMDDMELFEMILEFDEGKYGKLPLFLKRLFGEKEIERLYDHVRVESGRVPMSRVSEEVGYIVNALNEVESKKK